MDVDLFNKGRFALKLSPAEASTVTDVSALPIDDRCALLNESVNGVVYRGFGFLLRWSAAHVRPSRLELMRQEGDPLGDAAISALRVVAGAQLADSSAVELLRRHRAALPAAEALLSSVDTAPPWVDWSRIERGQQFFMRNAGPICLSLLNLALIGGFGAPRINAVLEATGYLTRGRATQRRLSETLQMVLDCLLPGSLRPGGGGWESVLNVRLLHAGVRTWIMRHAARRTAATAAAAAAASAVAASEAPAAASALSASAAAEATDSTGHAPLAGAPRPSSSDPTPASSQDGSPPAATATSPSSAASSPASSVSMPAASTSSSTPSSSSSASASSGSSPDPFDYDASVIGVPINQEDMLVTALAFSTVTVMGLERVGLLKTASGEPIPDDDIACYLHLWRLIAHYMGVAPQHNGQNLETLAGAQAALESLAAHLVCPGSDSTAASSGASSAAGAGAAGGGTPAPGASSARSSGGGGGDGGSSRRIAMHVIAATSFKPPAQRSPLTHGALTRLLAGNAYADSLGIPRLQDPDLIALHKARGQLPQATPAVADASASVPLGTAALPAPAPGSSAGVDANVDGGVSSATLVASVTSEGLAPANVADSSAELVVAAAPASAAAAPPGSSSTVPLGSAIPQQQHRSQRSLFYLPTEEEQSEPASASASSDSGGIGSGDTAPAGSAVAASSTAASGLGSPANIGTPHGWAAYLLAPLMFAIARAGSVYRGSVRAASAAVSLWQTALAALRLQPKGAAAKQAAASTAAANTSAASAAPASTAVTEDEEARRLAAEAEANAAAILRRMRIIQIVTHLPLVGLPAARLIMRGIVHVLALQLGGRTTFSLRRKFH